jgi:hypothetical protein
MFVDCMFVDCMFVDCMFVEAVEGQVVSNAMLTTTMENAKHFSRPCYNNAHSPSSLPMLCQSP